MLPALLDIEAIESDFPRGLGETRPGFSHTSRASTTTA
jgi:hypothetical protein